MSSGHSQTGLRDAWITMDLANISSRVCEGLIAPEMCLILLPAAELAGNNRVVLVAFVPPKSTEMERSKLIVRSLAKCIWKKTRGKFMEYLKKQIEEVYSKIADKPEFHHFYSIDLTFIIRKLNYLEPQRLDYNNFKEIVAQCFPSRDSDPQYSILVVEMDRRSRNLILRLFEQKREFEALSKVLEGKTVADDFHFYVTPLLVAWFYSGKSPYLFCLMTTDFRFLSEFQRLPEYLGMRCKIIKPTKEDLSLFSAFRNMLN